MKKNVSVIVPVYNVDKYLKECLDSLNNQTFKDFEVIAINDGSTDNSLEILKRYEKIMINLKVINQKNKGLSVSRNVGMENSSGKYLIFVDSDDMLKENTLELLFNLAEKGENDLVIYDGKKIDEINKCEDHKIYNRSKIYKSKYIDKDQYLEGMIKKGVFQVPLHFYNRMFLINNNIRFKENLLHEDELFNMQVYSKINGEIGYCNKKLYIRRYRVNSIMSGNLYNNYKSLESYLYILDEFSKMKNKFNDENFINLLNHRASMIMCNLIRYRSQNLNNIIKYRKEFDFRIKYVRLIANCIVYKNIFRK